MVSSNPTTPSYLPLPEEMSGRTDVLGTRKAL